MNHQKTFTLTVVGVVLLISSVAMAQTAGADYGAADLENHTTSIQSYLYGAVMKLIAMGTGAFALAHGLLGHFQKIVSWGSVSLITLVMPSFINGIYRVSGMLLP
jgi:hypothetical protein